MRHNFSLKLDLNEKGLDMFFKPYQQKVFEVLWDNPNGLSSRQVWDMTNKELSQKISRASIINFLNDSVELGLLSYSSESGKGGFRRIYSHKFYRNCFSRYLKSLVLKSLESLRLNF